MRRLSIAFGTALTIGATVAWAVTQSTAERLIAQGSEGAAREPVVAELFTSEGCSSCPAADDVLTRLVVSQPIPGVEIIALGEHVDYWDRLGWRDPFSSAGYTARQSQYGSHVFRTGNIYTPQLVIDGVTEAVGSDERRIRTLLAAAARTPKPRLTVEASLKPDGTLTASVSGAGVSASDAELWWAITEDNLVVDVKRGENASRTLRHSGVVRRLSAGKVTPGINATLTLPGAANWKRENLRVVAFLQSKDTRRVLSVGFAQVF